VRPCKLDRPPCLANACSRMAKDLKEAIPTIPIIGEVVGDDD
jgi:hypothetical protein